MDTIGSLVDKLTIVNLRIWMLEDLKRTSDQDSIVADATRRTNLLNQQRNDLIQEIDDLANQLAKGIPVKTYKQGDMKMYGRKGT